MPADLASHGPPATKVRFSDILRIPAIRVAVFGTFVIMLGWGILAPILPLYARSFGVDYGAVGILIAAFGLTRLLFDLFAGPLVDSFGERAIVTGGAVVVGVSSALAAVAPTFPLLVAFRAAGGAGSAVFFVAINAYLLRESPKELMGRVMALFYGAFNLGVILGQPVGGMLAHFIGLASPLWAYAITCFATAAVYLRALPRRAGRGTPESPLRTVRALRWNRQFITVLVSTYAYAWMIAAVWSTLLPLFATERVGLTEFGVGAALALAAAAEFAVLFHAGAITDRLGRKAILMPAFVVLAITIALLGVWASVATLLILLVLLGLGSGYAGVPPAVMLADVVPPEHRAGAVGVSRFAIDLGFVTGPIVAGVAASTLGFTAAFALSAIPCLVAVAFLASIADTRPLPDREPAASTTA